jgi:hypothetical protein
VTLFDKLFGRGGPKSPPDQTEAILGRHLDKDFIAFPMAELRQTLASVEAVSRKIDIAFPPEFSAHLCGRFPGVYVEVKEQVWPRQKLYDIGPFWSFLYGVHTFTSAPDSEPWMRLDHAAETFRSNTGHHAAPVLQVVGDANLYCVNAAGQLVHHDHETNELEPVPLDFWQLFEREISELRARKNKKTAGA